eukprot:CAMPEP_0180167972 /NCGR_PEP_ID=MMETSP0986-20121125/32422_1 /TAXON_ID=697907 /ORGANISM="non described non described, Strain CCMP2293" /LENGTH=116 /DNA_ID=CAMNT_0022119319 /DNA_START=63 /DNA_END=409 /DNA_ORIENTATION=-
MADNDNLKDIEALISEISKYTAASPAPAARTISTSPAIFVGLSNPAPSVLPSAVATHSAGSPGVLDFSAVHTLPGELLSPNGNGSVTFPDPSANIESNPPRALESSDEVTDIDRFL